MRKKSAIERKDIMKTDLLGFELVNVILLTYLYSLKRFVRESSKRSNRIEIFPSTYYCWKGLNLLRQKKTMNHNRLSLVSLEQTKKYFVFEKYPDHNGASSTYKQYQCNYSPNIISEIKKKYERDGFCIYRNLFHLSHIESSRNFINKIVKVLINHYDSLEDEFQDFDREDHNIVRMPRIGRGKHNIHFDPEFSEQHQVLSQMVSEAGVLDLLSTVSGGVCSLRETGMSLTRPQMKAFGTITSGEGMEWHSDGAKGEYTMLLGLEDVYSDMGSLRIVPSSHLEYVEGIGHEESILKAKKEELEQRKIDYCYIAGEPIIFDARTLHSVNNNHSDQWRVVLWFIMDCY